MHKAVSRRLGTHVRASDLAAILGRGGSLPDRRVSTARLPDEGEADHPRTKPEADAWTPVERSLGTRKISMRSRRAHRVSLPDPDRREVRTESLGEASLVRILHARQEVETVIEQPPYVIYVGDDGKEHKHWFDCIAVLKDGRRIAYVFKPRVLVPGQGTERLVELLAMQIDPEVADEVRLVRDDEVTPELVYNAETIASVRNHGPSRDDRSVAAVEAAVRSPMLLDAAVLSAGHPGEGFRAVVRLIADGVLRLVGDGIIDYGAIVEPVKASAGASA